MPERVVFTEPGAVMAAEPSASGETTAQTVRHARRAAQEGREHAHVRHRDLHRRGDWQADQPLTLHVAHRDNAVAPDAAPETGTTVTWSSPKSGNGSVTFFDNGTRFEGTAQFSNEGPVAYRGTLAD
ncbi:hypothetical protein ACFC8N_47520 [Streptomyces sp. NPDC055966]|uniref:hypothetical protein n=1 Tax=unclassified Streptomyces TaxID=2593676 RepID=UPI0035D7CFA8